MKVGDYMLIIDDSKLKLLKMKEKMLELAGKTDLEALDEYRDLAVSIDEDCYQMIIKEIKDSNYNNLPLEEQIKTLRVIEDDYNYLNELQCGFRNVYSKYKDEELSLTNLDNILVDNIQARISQIEGYLMNAKNLKSNKLELDRLNQSLIAATDGKKQVGDLINDIQAKLREEVKSARGRKYAKDDKLAVTSIAIELQEFGINLSEIINDGEWLDKVYSDLLNEKKEKQETLNTALSLPNKDEAICAMYMEELLKSNYKLVIVELIKEVFSDNDDYDLFKDSLYKIEDLIKEIKNNLKELNIKFYINPFNQIKIKDYIHQFEKSNDYEVDISSIKETMIYLSNMIDEMEKHNSEFLSSISDDVPILKEDTNTVYLDIPKEKDEVISSDDVILELLKPDAASDNQVIKIRNLQSDFMKSRVKEKTDSVIKRVCEMYCPKEKKEIVPDLVIEKPIEVVKEEEAPIENVKEEVEPFLEPTLFEEIKDSEIFSEDNIEGVKKEETVPIEEAKEEVDLFKEVEPFLQPTLFEERKDSEIFSEDNIEETKEEAKPLEENDEMKMPDVFWVSKEESDENK